MKEVLGVITALRDGAKEEDAINRKILHDAHVIAQWQDAREQAPIPALEENAFLTQGGRTVAGQLAGV